MKATRGPVIGLTYYYNHVTNGCTMWLMGRHCNLSRIVFDMSNIRSYQILLTAYSTPAIVLRDIKAVEVEHIWYRMNGNSALTLARLVSQ